MAKKYDLFEKKTKKMKFLGNFRLEIAKFVKIELEISNKPQNSADSMPKFMS